ncbi:unnamed protein product [marine sediment metagenome]|uniref:Uncharacterized protein n=1 Tax=marine sediment metagenome TaxID=412755 RepID=X0SQI0_9ZZZZ
MEKISFKTDIVDGDECVMSTKKIDIREIRFNIKSREISIYYEKPKKTYSEKPKKILKKVGKK